jgi:hypothetical protein
VLGLWLRARGRRAEQALEERPDRLPRGAEEPRGVPALGRSAGGVLAAEEPSRMGALVHFAELADGDMCVDLMCSCT